MKRILLLVLLAIPLVSLAGSPGWNDDEVGRHGFSIKVILIGLAHALPVFFMGMTGSYFLLILSAAGMSYIAYVTGNPSYFMVDMAFIALGFYFAHVGIKNSKIISTIIPPERSQPPDALPVRKKAEGYRHGRPVGGANKLTTDKSKKSSSEQGQNEGGSYWVLGLVILGYLGFLFLFDNNHASRIKEPIASPPTTQYFQQAETVVQLPPLSAPGPQQRVDKFNTNNIDTHRKKNKSDLRHCLGLPSNKEIINCTSE